MEIHNRKEEFDGAIQRDEQGPRDIMGLLATGILVVEEADYKEQAV